MDVMIVNTCGFERMSFMDEFSRYNQIKMYPHDEKHTSFRTPLAVYCYTVMTFGLKNARATYQRATNVIFHEHIHKIVECYVDDIAAKKLLAQRPITLVLMMINSCSYITNNLVIFSSRYLIKILVGDVNHLEGG